MAQNLCGYSQEEITEMLCAIKEICKRNECEECPFDIDGECKIRELVPENWEVSLSNVWHAFL